MTSREHIDKAEDLLRLADGSLRIRGGHRQEFSRPRSPNPEYQEAYAQRAIAHLMAAQVRRGEEDDM